MKKLSWPILSLLLLIQLFYPVCIGVSLALELDFSLYDRQLYALCSAGLMVAATLALWKCPNGLCLLLLPAAVVNSCLWGIGVWNMLAAFVNICCAGLLLYRYRGRGAMVSAVLSGLCILAFIPLLCAACFIGSLMPRDTLLQEQPSPDGRFTARVIYSDQGALGRDVYVELYDHSGDVELLVGKFSRPTQRIWSGKTEDVQITWLDNETLFVNEEKICIINRAS